MRTAPALLIVLAATLALTGCQPDDSPLVVDPSPSVTPIFESDEEALAAAEAAYAEYLAVSAEILSHGGVDPERLLGVATQELFESELPSLKEFAENGWRSEGASSVDSLSLQSYDPYAAAGDASVIVYACLDVSATDVFDAEGNSVVSESRPDRTPFETVFAYSPEAPHSLLMSEKSVWTGDDFCN
jgi:hypothetical protein